MIHKKHRVIALAVLLVLQTLILVSWQSRKQGDFVDEFYTLADAHEFSVTGKKQMYFHEQEDWQPERWLTVGLFQDRLTVSPEFDAEDFSVPVFLKTFVTGRNYMGMLNLTERVLSPGELSRTSAFFLNIVSFLGLQLLVYALLRRMKVRFIPAMLCLILLGGCTMMLSMAVYIRFYLWTGMLFAGTVLLHCLMWTETRPVRNLLMEAGAVFLLYLGLRNSELIIVLAGALVLSFTVGLLIRKRWAQAAYYAGPIITGGIGYLALKTGFLTALLDPGSTEAASGQTGALLQTLGNTDLPGFWEHIGLFFDTLG